MQQLYREERKPQQKLREEQRPQQKVQQLTPSPPKYHHIPQPSTTDSIILTPDGITEGTKQEIYESTITGIRNFDGIPMEVLVNKSEKLNKCETDDEEIPEVFYEKMDQEERKIMRNHGINQSAFNTSFEEIKKELFAQAEINQININYPTAESFISSENTAFRQIKAGYKDPVMKQIFGDHSINVELLSYNTWRPLSFFGESLNKDSTFKVEILLSDGQYTFAFSYGQFEDFYKKLCKMMDGFLYMSNPLSSLTTSYWPKEKVQSALTIFFHKLLTMDSYYVQSLLTHFIFHCLNWVDRAQEIEKVLPMEKFGLKDNRSFAEKHLYGFILHKYNIFKLKKSDDIFKAFTKEVKKLKIQKDLVVKLYNEEVRLRKEILKLNKDIDSFHVIQENLVDELANSTNSDGDILQELNEDNLEQNKVLHKKVDEFILILKGGKEISLKDIETAGFLVDSCLQDLVLIETRMSNSNYKEDQHFMNYFQWYRRVMKNISRFLKKIILSRPNTQPEKTSPTTEF